MSKLWLLCFLTFGNLSAMAQGTSETSLSAGGAVLAANSLKQGQREVNGGFNLTAGQTTTYNISAGYAHFWRDQLSFSGELSVSSVAEKVTPAVGLGVQYYFALTGAFAPFISQQISVVDGSPLNYGGKSKIGVLYLLTPNVGFKTFGQWAYPLDKLQAVSFSVLGEFAIYL